MKVIGLFGTGQELVWAVAESPMTLLMRNRRIFLSILGISGPFESKTYFV
jgi:hypothetical protein